MLFMSLFVMLSRLFNAALWSPAWKGLTSWLSFEMFNCTYITFSCGILGQVWYLIVFIPDLCPFLTLNVNVLYHPLMQAKYLNFISYI